MKILWMMKRKRMARVVFCASMAAALAAGCGRKEEKLIPVDIFQENVQDGEMDQVKDSDADESVKGQMEDSDEDEPVRGQMEDSDGDEPAKKQAEDSDGDSLLKGQTEGSDKGESAEASVRNQEKAPENHKDGNEELEGDVRSVGQGSFVISRITVYSDGDAQVAVGVAPGAAGEELVTVYVNENCTYRYETVKNSGINPEDISTREGTFADLREGLVVDMEGIWQDGSFYADSMVMREFI